MPKIKNHAPGEYYHLFNRGVQKQIIFNSDKDRLRFLFLLLTFQGKNPIKNITREIKRNTKISPDRTSVALHITPELEKEITENRTVELVSFCLMPNHFHLLITEKEEGGIAKFMQRVETAYTMYFNKRYNKSGHLFQGSYKSVHMEDDTQLMHLSAYVHKNPSELKEWTGQEATYPWSSLQDYLTENRFGDLLTQDIILDRYKNGVDSYKEFIKTSTAKEDLV
jgi:putative transposase